MSNRRKPAAQKVRVTPSATDRVVVAHIHPGEVSSYFHTSLLNLCMLDAYGPRRIVGNLEEWSSANVSASRNAVTARFLDEYDADWLLWIDADMSFGHDALEQLLAAADRETRPIVGGLCFGMANDRLFPTIYQFVQTPAGTITTTRVSEYPDDELVQCAATGAAFVLIHRDVLAKMRAHGFNAAFPWFQETELDGRPAGEDITFCVRAGILGVPIYVHTGVRVGHHKSTVLDHEMFQAQREAVGHGG